MITVLYFSVRAWRKKKGEWEWVCIDRNRGTDTECHVYITSVNMNLWNQLESPETVIWLWTWVYLQPCHKCCCFNKGACIGNRLEDLPKPLPEAISLMRGKMFVSGSSGQGPVIICIGVFLSSRDKWFLSCCSLVGSTVKELFSSLNNSMAFSKAVRKHELEGKGGLSSYFPARWNTELKFLPRFFLNRSLKTVVLGLKKIAGWGQACSWCALALLCSFGC